MDWLRKYKFKNSNNEIPGIFKYIINVLGKNLSNFEYSNKISEEEFLKGEILYLKEGEFKYSWLVNKNMVEKDLIKIRKNKLKNGVYSDCILYMKF